MARYANQYFIVADTLTELDVIETLTNMSTTCIFCKKNLCRDCCPRYCSIPTNLNRPVRARSCNACGLTFKRYS